MPDNLTERRKGTTVLEFTINKQALSFASSSRTLFRPSFIDRLISISIKKLKRYYRKCIMKRKLLKSHYWKDTIEKALLKGLFWKEINKEPLSPKLQEMRLLDLTKDFTKRTANENLPKNVRIWCVNQSQFRIPVEHTNAFVHFPHFLNLTWWPNKKHIVYMQTRMNSKSKVTKRSKFWIFKLL